MENSWLQWLIEFIGAAGSAIIGGVATGAYFVGRTTERLERLEQLVFKNAQDRESVEEHVQEQIRRAVHDLRGNLQEQNSLAATTTRRVEERLAQLDSRIDARFAQVIDLIVHPERRGRP